jgi:hypothetical protein
MRRLTLALSALALLASTVSAQAFDTTASSAYVVDFDTGTVLLAKRADAPLPPASMSKLMTLYMTFEALAQDQNGTFTLETELPVSAAAQAYRGSTMFLVEGERVSVEDLIRGIIVLSGNDATVVLGEALGGTDAAFAQKMTVRAQQMGMTNSTFINSNGWPRPGHVMSMRDLGLLTTRLIGRSRSATRAATVATCSRSARSACSISACTPVALRRTSASSLKRSRLRATSTTSCPAVASCHANSSPSPALAPVINAVAMSTPYAEPTAPSRKGADAASAAGAAR